MKLAPSTISYLAKVINGDVKDAPYKTRNQIEAFFCNFDYDEQNNDGTREAFTIA